MQKASWVFDLDDQWADNPHFFMLTTVRENAPWLKDLLGVSPQKFRPSIPNLVYQYDLYVNYESEPLSRLNPEIPED